MRKTGISEWASKMPLKEQFVVTKRIFRYTFPFKRRFIVALLIGVLTSFITAAMPRVVQLYLDQYVQTQSATMQITVAFIVGYLMLIVCQLLSGYLSNFYFKTASEKTVELIRNTIYQKISGHGMRYFDQTPAGSIVSRITNDTETLKSFWQVFYSLFEGFFSLVAVFIGMYLLNAHMALLFLLFVPVMIGIILIYQNYSSRVYRMMRENLSQLNTKLNESIMGMSIIQQFRQEARLTKEFEEDNNTQYRARVAVIQMNALLLNPVINLLEGIALATILYVLGGQFLQGTLAIGMIYAFTQYCTNFFRPMGMMMDNLSLLQDGVVSSARLLKVLDHQELVPAQDVNPQAQITQAKVEFRNVTFSYDGVNDVLKNVSFTVNPGETIALVGHTGSGKSSIINVLMRFYEFQSGDVLIDGHSIRHFDYATLRQQMGLVLQDAFLFYGDINRNIRLLDTTISDATVQHAAKFVNADTFIEQDPVGYRKKVIERGASYSSGQKQLISFARTMARNPKLLILDEATANIDTQTEEFIQESLRKMRQGRTTIAIAHRLSTIRDANQILVLDKGRIIERGTHDELIALGGTYYQMYQLQSLG